MNIKNLENNERKYVSSLGNFHVLEYQSDASVAPENARNEYFMSKMGVRRRQIVIELNGKESAIIQAGSIAEAAYGIPDWIKGEAYSYLDEPLKDVLRRWKKFISKD